MSLAYGSTFSTTSCGTVVVSVYENRMIPVMSSCRVLAGIMGML